jgi:hypothetical protein
MNREELALLTQEEIIDLVLRFSEQQEKLLATFQQMQMDHETLKLNYEALKVKFEQNQKPPTSSQNSSQPPSRDQESNTAKDKPRHRHGPPQGHVKYVRKFVAQPDQVVNLHVQSCGKCQADLRGAEGRLLKVNQITEVPEAQAQVIEVRQYETTCPKCGQVPMAEPPAGLELERTYGARLEVTVVYYRQE